MKLEYVIIILIILNLISYREKFNFSGVKDKTSLGNKPLHQFCCTNFNNSTNSKLSWLKPSLPNNLPEKMKELTYPEPREYIKCNSKSNCRKFIFI